MVKIGQFGLQTDGYPRKGSPRLQDEFDALPEDFFSLGQSEDYYLALNALPPEQREQLLVALRDVARDLDLLERAHNEASMQKSLLRSVMPATIRGRFHRLAMGNAELTAFDFRYDFPPSPTGPVSIDFQVEPEAQPPTNIHILIGRNGVGKTRCLRGITRSLVVGARDPDQDGTVSEDNDFANVVSVTFSAFDPFDPLIDMPDAPIVLPYTYIGLKALPNADGDEAGRPKPPKTVEELTSDFAKSVAVCRRGMKAQRWRRALTTLQADPLFSEAEVLKLADVGNEADAEAKAKKTYHRLSSGHKIVLLTITRLVETVDERSLVLIDEPEAHLHPPLLSAFVRSLSDLLVERNAVAIIATHSPVVLQEAPRSCVWILGRVGAAVRAERPRLETFGENVGVLTSEVFGLEVTESGFHKLVEKAAGASASYEALLNAFSNQLGAEARSIGRAAIATKQKKDP